MDEYEKFLKDWEKVFQEYPSMKKELVSIISLRAKQTAPQGLVGELSKRLKYDYTVDQLAQPQEVEDEWQEWLANVLSRYRPAPTSEEGLREKMEKIANETISPPIPEVLFDVLIDRIMSAIPAPSKPTADASLVEVDCSKCNGTGLMQIAPNVRGMTTCDLCKGKRKLFTQTRDTPAPSKADKLVRRLRELAKSARLTGDIIASFQIVEILRDFEGGK